MKTIPWKFVDSATRHDYLHFSSAWFEDKKPSSIAQGDRVFENCKLWQNYCFGYRWESAFWSNVDFMLIFYATKHRRPWPVWFLFLALLAGETSASREDLYESRGAILLSKWVHRQISSSLFTLVIRRCFSLKNICEKIEFHVPRQTCWCKRPLSMLV